MFSFTALLAHLDAANRDVTAALKDGSYEFAGCRLRDARWLRRQIAELHAADNATPMFTAAKEG